MRRRCALQGSVRRLREGGYEFRTTGTASRGQATSLRHLAVGCRRYPGRARCLVMLCCAVGPHQPWCWQCMDEQSHHPRSLRCLHPYIRADLCRGRFLRGLSQTESGVHGGDGLCSAGLKSLCKNVAMEWSDNYQNYAPGSVRRAVRAQYFLGPSIGWLDYVMQAQSTITCPHCGHHKIETMPTDACQFFYDCEGCGEVLWPHKGDCCVYCSYGTVPCPPIQEARASGGPTASYCS